MDKSCLNLAATSAVNDVHSPVCVSASSASRSLDARVILQLTLLAPPAAALVDAIITAAAVAAAGDDAVDPLLKVCCGVFFSGSQIDVW